MEEKLAQFNDFVTKLQFGGNARITFYEALILMLENNVQLNEALSELYAVASDDGRKPKDPQAIIFQSCLNSLAGGSSLSEALEPWIDPAEVALLKAGERSGELGKSMRYAIDLIIKKKAMIGAVIGATAYPSVLMVMAGVLMYIISNQLVPKLANLTSPKNWNGAAYVLYLLADFSTNYGLYFVGFLIVAIITSLATLPYFRGPIRVKLDRLFPWSSYRMLHGSSFLLSVALMVGSGQQLREALLSLMRTAKPWLSERIEGALEGLENGQNFGEALKYSGYEFPDRIAIKYLTVFANRSGFEHSMVNYANRWAEQSVVYMKKMAGILLSIGLLIIGSLLILVIIGVGGITEAIQAGATH